MRHPRGERRVTHRQGMDGFALEPASLKVPLRMSAKRQDRLDRNHFVPRLVRVMLRRRAILQFRCSRPRGSAKLLATVSDPDAVLPRQSADPAWAALVHPHRRRIPSGTRCYKSAAAKSTPAAAIVADQVRPTFADVIRTEAPWCTAAPRTSAKMWFAP